MKFRKKPVVIEAVQIKERWFDDAHPNDAHPIGITIEPVQRAVFISTLEGVMRGEVGDWIITGVKGERYPCKPDVFEMTYERADDVEDCDNFDCLEFGECGSCELEDDDEDDGVVYGVGLSMGGISGIELELNIELNGQEGKMHMSPLFYEAIKEHWSKATMEKYGWDYERCLEEDRKNFNEGLRKSEALKTKDS